MGSECFWRLDSDNTTLLLMGNGSAPACLVYFGASLPIDATLDSDLAGTLERPRAKATLNQNDDLHLLPTLGVDVHKPAALSGHAPDGSRWNPVFRHESVELDTDANSISVQCVDGVSRLAVTLRLELDAETDVLIASSVMENRGDTPWVVDHLASLSLPLPGFCEEALLMQGRWGGEFQQRRLPLGSARLQIDNLSGRSSHEHFPGCLIGQQGFGPMHGAVLGAQLAWNGNFRLLIDSPVDGQRMLQMGALPLPAELTLAPQARWRSPDLLICYSSSGSNTIAQRFHQHLRKRVLPACTRKARPVHANSWEALYFDHRQSSLFELIDTAAELGAERFVLDDGWFRNRVDDQRALGDWVVDQARYPQGLEPLVARVRQRGMQFGLWFEPEMISPESLRYHQDPSVILNFCEQDPPTGRHQWVLNLAREDVFDSVLGQIAVLIATHHIDYIKWDHNRWLQPAADGQRPVAIEQAVAVRRMMRELRERFGWLEIESCASGGGRIDAAMFAECSRAWTSDSIDPIDRLSIQRGFLQFFPPEVMGSHLGADRAHLSGRVSDLATRACVALQGQFGFEFDTRVPVGDERKAIAEYTALYKRHRGWLAECTWWQLPTRDPALYASGAVSCDRKQSLFTIVASASAADRVPERLPLAGLDPDTLYRVIEHTNAATRLLPYCDSMPRWVASPMTLSGAHLNRLGLQLPILPAQQALLLECVAVDVGTAA